MDLEHVKDWEERIRHYSPKQKEFYRRMVPALDELLELEKDEGWRSLVKDEPAQVFICTRKGPNGFPMMRAQGRMDMAPIWVFRAGK